MGGAMMVVREDGLLTCWNARPAHVGPLLRAFDDFGIGNG